MIALIAQLMFYVSPDWFWHNTPYIEKLGYSWEFYRSGKDNEYRIRVWQ